MNHKQFFYKKRIREIMFIAVLVGIYFFASYITEYDFVKGLASFPKSIIWMATNLIPDEQAMERLPDIISKLIETVLLSISVTVLAAIIAFLAALFGSSATGFNGVINRAVRIFAAFFRNVPDVVWAMILLFSFGQNILTGFFALFFTTFGLLTRAFIETIDEVSASCVEALTSSGANFPQIVSQGILPQTITGVITWILYMIETNVRNQALIGMLTATGIGYLFDLYYKRLQFGSASLVIILIVFVVLIIENTSNFIRRAIR